jgi:hypothetical protein
VEDIRGNFPTVNFTSPSPSPSPRGGRPQMRMTLQMMLLLCNLLIIFFNHQGLAQAATTSRKSIDIESTPSTPLRHVAQHVQSRFARLAITPTRWVQLTRYSPPPFVDRISTPYPGSPVQVLAMRNLSSRYRSKARPGLTRFAQANPCSRRGTRPTSSSASRRQWTVPSAWNRPKAISG